MKITLAHSPDPDDAFMFYALAKKKIPSDGFEIRHVLKDIESLNRAAQKGTYDITAVSFHAYAHVARKYRLLACGASVGDRYGPILVGRAPLAREEIGDRIVAVPGTLTTAYLALKLAHPAVTARVIPFDTIPEAVAKGEADLGLVIHEGQLTYGDLKLHKILDLGEWWHARTGLPLPLGGNAIRRGIPAPKARALAALLKASIRYALDHRDAALTHALKLGRGIDRSRGDRFVGMYVNDWTLDLGPKGREAVRRLLDEGHAANILPKKVEPEFIE